jgi:hypothetical protein
MNKPSGFSLSSLSVSLAKIPKTYLYAAAGAVLLGALGVVALNMLSAPPVEEFVPPVVSTPTTNPATGNPSTSNPSTSNPAATTSSNPSGTNPTAGNTSNPSGSDDIGSGPSRSLEVQPIPFLVTEAIKTDPNNPTRATTQALNTRPASSAVVNPFAPLSVESTGNVGVVQNGSTPISGGPISTPRQTISRPSVSFAPVRQPGTVTIRQPQPLPSFPSTPQARPQARPQPRPTPGPTLPKTGGPITIKPPTQNAKIVPKIPAAIANAKPSVQAPKPGVSGPSSSVALTNPAPSTPGLMRNVVPANKPTPLEPPVQPPVDPGTTVIPTVPTVPTDPELDFAALTEPNILGGPIELREPGTASTEAPSPLDSSIPRAPVKPPQGGTETTPVEQPPVVPVERIDPLNAFVTARGMSFVGVVLGPVNTAIFETKDGTIVVPLGANLPQSDVIVKTITADQVVLMQGQDTIILSRAK